MVTCLKETLGSISVLLRLPAAKAPEEAELSNTDILLLVLLATMISSLPSPSISAELTVFGVVPAAKSPAENTENYKLWYYLSC